MQRRERHRQNSTPKDGYEQLISLRLSRHPAPRRLHHESLFFTRRSARPENHDVQIIQVGGDSLPFSVLDSDGRRDTSGGSGGSRSEDAHSWVLHRARDHVFHEQCGYAA